MNFHSTITPRIREIPSTCTVEHTVTLHYSDTNCAVGVDNVVVVVENDVEEVIGDGNSYT